MIKTEKEKMLAGELYQAFDPALVAERAHAKELIYRYNQLPPSGAGQRKELMQSLLGSCKSEFLIEQPFYCDYGYNIHLGERFYANTGCTILDCAPVYIGDDVMLGPNVSLYTAGHPLDASLRNTGVEYAYSIHIGDSVWIGGNTVIVPGVGIGSGSVIGAGSVVVKDIPPGVVAVGNPCVVIKHL